LLPVKQYSKREKEIKTELKNQTSGKHKVDTYFPISKLTAKSVNPKVYHNAPAKLIIIRGLYQGALRILFYLLYAFLSNARFTRTK